MPFFLAAFFKTELPNALPRLFVVFILSHPLFTPPFLWGNTGVRVYYSPNKSVYVDYLRQYNA